MSMPALWLNSSPARCDAEPAPVEAKSTLPGFFLDSCTNSASVFAPAALATTCCAILPPAPPLLTTTTDWPMFSPSFLAISRAAASAAPPAAKPTTSVTGFLGGKSCAAAPNARGAVASARAQCSRVRFFMGVSFIVGGVWIVGSVGAQTDGVGLALFHRVAQQRSGAENAVRKLAVGHGGEQRHHRAQVQAQQQRQGSASACPPQRQAAGGGEEQQGDEGAVHGLLRGVAVLWVAAQVQPP